MATGEGPVIVTYTQVAPLRGAALVYEAMRPKEVDVRFSTLERVDIVDADEHPVPGGVVDEAGACLVGVDRPVPMVVGLPVSHGGGLVGDGEVAYRRRYSSPG